MSSRRFINSIVATSQTTSVKLPWHRALRAEKRTEKQMFRTAQQRSPNLKRAA